MNNKKIQHRKLYRMGIAGLTLLFYTSSALFAAPRHVNFDSTEINRHTNGLFQAWFKPQASVNDLVANQSSKELWDRMRTRLNLNSTKQSTLVQKHLKTYSKSPDYINKLVRNASPYLFYILEEVEKRGMPSEIALLPMIESEFNPHDISHKGALGLWQIMPSLGHIHGLKQNASYDGRQDIYESTKVALDHLAYLHKKFDGNWLLAIAAYNCGEGALARAIQKNRRAKKPTDFWALPLPTETKHFVPKLLALAAIIKSPSVYGVALPAIPNQPVFTRIKTVKPIDIAHAARLIDVSETQLRRLNPGHKSNKTSAMHLVVPIQKAGTVETKIKKAPAAIAKETKSVKAAAPKVASAKKISTKGDITVVSKGKSKKTKHQKTHTVKAGESIPSISIKHNVKISTLLALNGFGSPHEVLQPKQKVIIG